MRIDQTTSNAATELTRCIEGHAGLSGFMYFMVNYAYLLCKNRGHVKWTAWDCHHEYDRLVRENTRIIILKGRQLGISWQTAGYALWTAMFHQGQTVLLLSQGEEESQDLLLKCIYIYKHCPAWMRPQVGKQNESTFSFPGLYSEINALPSTAKAGRSAATNLVVCDEWAFHPYADLNWAALQPTLGVNARLIGISTANGRGNLFHRMWEGAKKGANGFTAQFFSCFADPSRDDEWYEQQKKEYAHTPQLLAQEFPRNEVEAFLASGRCFFDVEAISWCLENIARRPIETRDGGRLKIWQKPVPGRRYVIGADVAQGLERGDTLDYSCAAVYDWKDLRQVAELHGQWPADQLAEKLFELGKEYNTAYLGVERNNHGHAVLLVLRQMGYPKLYHHRGELYDLKATGYYKTKEAEIGWPTTKRTKPIMEKTLAALIASKGLMAYCQEFWDECLNYVIKGDGSNGAQNGTHDDRVMAHAIAMQMREAVPADMSLLGPKWRFAASGS